MGVPHDVVCVDYVAIVVSHDAMFLSIALILVLQSYEEYPFAVFF